MSHLGYKYLFMYKNCFSANPMQLFNYVRQCLATEVRLIQAAGENFLGMPNLMVSNSGTEVMHKIEVLRGRTQVH